MSTTGTDATDQSRQSQPPDILRLLWQEINPTGACNSPDALIIHSAIRKQQAKGIAKYGVPLTRETPGDMLNHALEEAIDKSVYLMAEEARTTDPTMLERLGRMIFDSDRMIWRIAQVIVIRDNATDGVRES